MKDKRQNTRVLFDAQADVYSEKGEVISNGTKNICFCYSSGDPERIEQELKKTFGLE